MELKSTITENSLEGLNNGSDQEEERVSKLEEGSTEIIQTEKQKAKRVKKYEQNLRDLWDTIKHTNTRIMGSPRGGEKEKVAEKKKVEEIMSVNFSNFMKNIKLHIQEAQWIPSRTH